MRAMSLLFLFISLSACLKVTDLPKEDEPKPEIQTVSLELPKVETLDEANAYQVHLPFPSQALIAQRYLKETGSDLEMVPMNLKNGILTDINVQPGAVYVYQFGVIQNGSFQELKSYEVSIPKDLHIKGELILEADTIWTEFNRIFIAEGGKITTTGFHLAIEADQIISQGGVIQTFQAGSQSVGTDGRSGGLIRITARTGKGLLKVELRGQNGSQGAKGTAHPGSVPNCPNEITELLGFGISSGKQGNPGQNGFNGGNSGSADIRILDDHTLEIQSSLEVGQAGPGGLGGEGECIFPRLQLPGPQGITGSPGVAGNREKICIQNLRGRNCSQ